MICLFSEKFTDTEFLVDPQYLEMGKICIYSIKICRCYHSTRTLIFSEDRKVGQYQGIEGDLTNIVEVR